MPAVLADNNDTSGPTHACWSPEQPERIVGSVIDDLVHVSKSDLHNRNWIRRHRPLRIAAVLPACAVLRSIWTIGVEQRPLPQAVPG
jgi:hypothetical protein